MLEAPTATVVWARGGRLSTPPPGVNGILAGTTVDAVFAAARADGHEVVVESATLDDLRRADGIWLTSAIRGVGEVTELDGVAQRSRRELTARLNAYGGY